MIGGAELLELWGACDGQPLLLRGLLLLGVACPSIPESDLADVAIGDRNRSILDYRLRLWGPNLISEATCPRCGDRLELEFDLPSILATPAGVSEGPRLTTQDLLSVEGLSRTQARTELLARLSVEPEESGLAEADPLAEIVIQPNCPSCHHQWRVFLDPVAFVWSELESRAMRLIREIHRLARAYGWSEPEVLALSERRRQIYLRLLGAV
jgi:hypothetical protein